MQLQRLFNMQKVLDDKIIDLHCLENADLIPGTLLALKVELGELANEWQGFKHWKVDPQPKPKMLEEYVDGLSFVLSLGLQIGLSDLNIRRLPNCYRNITDCFNDLFYQIAILGEDISGKGRINPLCYSLIFDIFIILGEMLGFTWDQVEAAYLDKNKVNHQRQEDGY